IVERERRRARPAQYLRLRDEIGEARLPVVAQVEYDQGDAGDQQRRKRGRQDDQRQLESNRARHALEHVQGPVRTCWATESSREESLNRRFSAESSAISKRTRRSATTKLMTLP